MNERQQYRAQVFFEVCAKLGVAAVAVMANGCSIEIEPLQRQLYEPVAHSAQEAWPQAPGPLSPLDAAQIAVACANTAACQASWSGFGTEQPLITAAFCNIDVVFSAERAIPMTGWLGRFNERAEFFVPCVLAAGGECQAVNACLTVRHPHILCEEAGCKWTGDAPLGTSCNGAIASVNTLDSSFTRDCSRALAQCDRTSPTGCTDRPFSSCPPDYDPADRCDGNIRLGCDAFDHVSYHDCERLGGTCEALADGSQDCVYQDSPEPSCEGISYEGPQCRGDQLLICVNGQRVTVDNSPLCLDGDGDRETGQRTDY